MAEKKRNKLRPSVCFLVRPATRQVGLARRGGPNIGTRTSRHEGVGDIPPALETMSPAEEQIHDSRAAKSW